MATQTQLSWGLVVVIAAVLQTAMACGSDADGGNGAGNGGGTANDPDASMASMDVSCGGEQCEGYVIPTAAFMIPLPACCSTEPAGECGVDVGQVGALVGLTGVSCEPLNRPGSVSAAWTQSPIFSNALLAQANEEGSSEVIFPGCCLPSGECGYALITSLLSFGCIEADKLGYESSGSCSYDEGNLITAETGGLLFPGAGDASSAALSDAGNDG